MKFFVVGSVLLLALSAVACAQDKPSEGMTATAPQAWKVYKPDGAVKASKERAQVLGVRLLQAQTEMSERVSTTDLVTYVQQARHAASAVFSDRASAAHLMLQFTCVPGSDKVQVAYQGDLPERLLQDLQERLEGLPALKVSGDVKFQVELMIAPETDAKP